MSDAASRPSKARRVTAETAATASSLSSSSSSSSAAAAAVAALAGSASPAPGTHFVAGGADLWTKGLPADVWQNVLVPLMDKAELSSRRCLSTFWEQLWENFRTARVIQVPEDVPTLRGAIALVDSLYRHRLVHRTEYTHERPLVLRLGAGEHVVPDVNNSNNYHSLDFEGYDHMAIIGASAERTTIRGSISASYCDGLLLKGITFTHPEEDMATVREEYRDQEFPSNDYGPGLELSAYDFSDDEKPDANPRQMYSVNIVECIIANCGSGGLVMGGVALRVNVVDCAITKCGLGSYDEDPSVLYGGLNITDGIHSFTRCRFSDNKNNGAIVTGQDTLATFTDCEFTRNNMGLWVWSRAKVHLRGEETEVFANDSYGLLTIGCGSWPSGSIEICLPRAHNTCHDNEAGYDRDGDSGSIVNVPAPVLDALTPGTHFVTGHADLWTLGLPRNVWTDVLVPLMDKVELSRARRVSSFCNMLWERFRQANKIRVPRDVPTLRNALTLAYALRRQKRYSDMHRLVVQLGAGEHVIENIPSEHRSEQHHLEICYLQHVKFVGVSAEKTIIRGSLDMNESSDIIIENITFTHPAKDCIAGKQVNNDYGQALSVSGYDWAEAGTKFNVTVKACIFSNCGSGGLGVGGPNLRLKVMKSTFTKCGLGSYGHGWDYGGVRMSGGSCTFESCCFASNRNTGVEVSGSESDATFTDCKFSRNDVGLRVGNGAVVDLRGQATKIYANVLAGIVAGGPRYPGGNHPTHGTHWPGGTVNIHLPTSHDTCPGHDDGFDRFAGNGTIQNIDTPETQREV